MDCAEARKRLLENTLAPDDELREHCSACPSCSAEAAMIEIENAAISIMPEASPSDRLFRNVSIALEKERLPAHDLRDCGTALSMLALPLFAALGRRVYYPSGLDAVLAPIPVTWQQPLRDFVCGLADGQISLLHLYMALPGSVKFLAILLGSATAMSIGLIPVKFNSRRNI